MVKKLLRLTLALGVLVGVGAGTFLAIDAWRTRRDARERADSPQGRLPGGVVPLVYDLELRIDPGGSRFDGRVAIEIEVARPTDVVWLHGRDLDPASASVVLADGRRVEAEYDEMGHSGVVRLQLGETIEAGRARVEIAYSAPLGRKLAGAYRVEEGGEAYVFTQFEAIDARRAFPCFDEPAFKTPFDVSLVVPGDQVAVANAPELSRVDADGGFQRHVFATTPPLPTYLVAFAVGPFDVVAWEDVPPDEVRPNAVPLRGLAVKGRGERLSYALSHTAAILGELEAYFASPYPFGKLDLVAVPDFEAGAMENAGLITYRESILFVGDPPSVESERRYAEVHAHELAHQWHGNLVTMPWWEDLWLNEAFASWMEVVIAEAWDRDLELGRERVRNAHRVMGSDAYLAARQVRQPITSNHDIENAFDGITYEKGAAVIRMFERFLGEDTFRAGVRAHLKRFAWGTATTDDFMASIARAVDDSATEIPWSGEAFTAAFRSFVDQPGVPLLEADWSCDEKGVEIRLEQSRYLPLGSRGSPDETWHLPVCVRAIGETGDRRECLLVARPSAMLRSEGACPTALMPNAGADGYYRWSLSAEGWTALLASLDRLSEDEIYSVIDNLEAELRAGRVDLAFYLDAVRTFVKLDAWDLQLTPIEALNFVASYVAPADRRAKTRAYMEALYLPRYRQVGLEADTALDRVDPVGTALLRSRLVTFLALDARSSEVRQALLPLGTSAIGFPDGPVDDRALEADLLSPALTVALEELGQPFFAALVERIEDSDDPVFRRQAIRAVGQVDDPGLAEQARELVKSFSLHLNELPTLMLGQLRHPSNQEPLFRWIESSYWLLSPFLPDGYLAHLPLMASGFCDMEHYEEVRTFFEPRMRDVVGGPRSLASVLERIEVCAALVAAQPELELPSIGEGRPAPPMDG